MRADFRRIFREPRAPQVIDVVRHTFLNYGFQTLLVYRFGQWLLTGRSRLALWPFATFGLGIYYLLEILIRLLYDIHLDISVKIGSGLYIGHFGGIDVRQCILGEHCSLQQEVCIGTLPGETRGPTIGDHVWIGAHTKIYGPWQIGDGATIGAGSLVQRDVPPRCLALGSPFRILQKEFDNSVFL